MELPDQETCYRALQSRDPRFDGLLFVGVSSTGIYCRPVCPARTPKLDLADAASADANLFRACGTMQRLWALAAANTFEMRSNYA